MQDVLTKDQAAALGRAISCYLDKVEEPDEQFLLREIINKLGLRSHLTDYAQQML